MEWQKSIDRHNFSSIDVEDPKHEGSSPDPKLPLLVITNTTFEDVLYYRLRVWNRIGEIFSNTLHLNVKRGISKYFTEILNIYCIKNVTLLSCTCIKLYIYYSYTYHYCILRILS